MVSRIWSVGVNGIQGCAVSCECDLSNGIPAFELVGLPDTAVKESRERVLAAIRNGGFSLPGRRITVSLAPADVKKQGPSFDLPILLSVLRASGQLSAQPDDAVFIGELSLAGQLRPVTGALPAALCAAELGFRRVFVPLENAAEASLAEQMEVYGVRDVRELAAILQGSVEPVRAVPAEFGGEQAYDVDFADVRGQQTAKRALEIAAAGGHNIIMCGPPGAGKSMLAKRLPTILPRMSRTEMLETTKIYSVAGLTTPQRPIITTRPFRAPHHTATDVSIIGGGSDLHPGEVSLAHNGVLFLDELPEFNRRTLDVLRQPVEDGCVTVSRSAGSATFPARFMLVGAMNPCRCGWYGSQRRRCTCSLSAVQAYQSRVSGPLLDRIDIFIEVQEVDIASITGAQGGGETSAEIRKRVEAARRIQRERFEGSYCECNAQMNTRDLEGFCRVTGEAKDMLHAAYAKLNMTARSYIRTIRIARTVADLAGSEWVDKSHVAEALFYRRTSGEN